MLKHEYFADLSPDFKLDIEAVCNPGKSSRQVVDLDEQTEPAILGKRPSTQVIDLDFEPGKK